MSALIFGTLETGTTAAQSGHALRALAWSQLYRPSWQPYHCVHERLTRFCLRLRVSALSLATDDYNAAGDRTLFTLANAICGFIGIAVLMLLYGPQVTTACLLVFGAWFFDMADGMVARRLGVDGPLGAALDSLCDVVSFGVLPAAILVHGSEADPAQLFAIVASSTYLLAAIFRLGRYTATALADSAAKPR